MIISYPHKILNGQYIAPFGGFSQEIVAPSIGFEKRALINSGIPVYIDSILISLLEKTGVATPIFYKESFEIIPIDTNSPDALQKASNGSLVLPETLEDDFEKQPTDKNFFIINSVLCQYDISIADISEVLGILET